MSVTEETVSRQSGRERGYGRGLRIAAWLFLSGVAVTGCGRPQQPRSSRPAPAEPPLREAVVLPPPDEDDAAIFGLYSTLPGKMARMEELLNAIARFLEDPGFQDRLIADAEEFNELLTESRGLYPTQLLSEDESGFDQTIDQTAATAEELIGFLRAGDVAAARDALMRLDRQRREAHSRFSY